MTDISLFFSLKLNNNFELRVPFQCDLRIYSAETKKKNYIVHLLEKNDIFLFLIPEEQVWPVIICYFVDNP